MKQARVARGCRFLGYRRLRLSLLVTIVALVAALLGLGQAQGSTGGTSSSPGGTSSSPKGGKHAKAHKAQGNPFASRGMWIWYVSMSNGGNVASIVSTAHRYGIKTLMIKNGDGSGAWSQFSSSLVSTLHANGLRVCAWQYVYGDHPVAEANVGATAPRAGADCLLIDAESQYEGKYVSAQTYITNLRRLVGPNFPVALTSFPYVDFHPGLPYSVFLGPGGAQYNVPQMYWVDIGTTVDNVFAHTYVFNRPYQRTISPLGQIYNHPPSRDIRRFRQISRRYGARGVSWWDWQEATRGTWRALSQPVGAIGNFRPDTSYARLGSGARGDLVVWAQEHLVSAGQRVRIDGAFGQSTRSAVQRFQAAHGLPTIGSIGPATWQALLRYQPARVRWTSAGAQTFAADIASGATPVPKSATLPAKRYEIPRSLGAG